MDLDIIDKLVSKIIVETRAGKVSTIKMKESFFLDILHRFSYMTYDPRKKMPQLFYGIPVRIDNSIDGNFEVVYDRA